MGITMVVTSINSDMGALKLCFFFCKPLSSGTAKNVRLVPQFGNFFIVIEPTIVVLIYIYIYTYRPYIYGFGINCTHESIANSSHLFASAIYLSTDGSWPPSRMRWRCKSPEDTRNSDIYLILK